MRFGLSMASTCRYYFEPMFVVILFIGMALGNLPPRAEVSHRKDRPHARHYSELLTVSELDARFDTAAP